MNQPTKAKFFPPTRRFSFKRPVLFDIVADNSTDKAENENGKDKSENDQTNENDPHNASPPQPERPVIQPLSFSISCELLSNQDDSNLNAPEFDWIQDEIENTEFNREASFSIPGDTSMDVLNDELIY